jgi:hypothetical protein
MSTKRKPLTGTTKIGTLSGISGKPKKTPAQLVKEAKSEAGYKAALKLVGKPKGRKTEIVDTSKPSNFLYTLSKHDQFGFNNPTTREKSVYTYKQKQKAKGIQTQMISDRQRAASRAKSKKKK